MCVVEKMSRDVVMAIHKSIVIYLFDYFLGDFVPTVTFLPAGHMRSARPAGPKIAFMFSVCVCVCVCVCVRPQISRALSYVIPLLCHYSRERSGSY